MTQKNELVPHEHISETRPARQGGRRTWRARAPRRKPWLPAALAGILWRTLRNFGTHREVARLLELPPFVDAIQFNPKFGFKYLTALYLVQGLNVAERGACFRHHYQRLYNLFPDPLLRQVLNWSVTLHSFSEGGTAFAIILGTSRPCDKEGELSLVLQGNGENIYTLSFTVVPGWVLKSAQPEVLLISRLQGTPGCHSASIKAIRKAVFRLRFGAMLLAGLEGVAVALNIKEISSVTSTKNISYSAEHAARFQNAYEGFFAELGVRPAPDGFLTMSLPLMEAPLEALKGSYQQRAGERRVIKAHIRAACAAYLLREMRRPLATIEKRSAGAATRVVGPTLLPTRFLLEVDEPQHEAPPHLVN